MHAHPDFLLRAAVMAAEHRWVASPPPGAERVMLHRLGSERARAASLVRYAPASVFPAHSHPGGEEILVLSGIFSDSSGDDGPGWCLRHPPGSAHQPSSADGALILRLNAPGGALGWLRLPPGDAPELHAGGTGTTIYLKVGHLTGLAT